MKAFCPYCDRPTSYEENVRYLRGTVMFPICGRPECVRKAIQSARDFVARIKARKVDSLGQA